MLDQFNRYRDKDGYIVIDNIKDKQKLDNKTFGSREKYWFMLEDIKALFKINQKNGEDIKEIVNEQISNYLGIPSAGYDLAIYGDKKGVLTLPLINENDIFLPVLLLIFESKTVGISNDILTIYKALLENKATDEELTDIMNLYFANQVQDIFTFQFDRNINNSGIVLGKQGFSIAPRFDSSGSFLKFFNDNSINKFLLRTDKREYVYKKGWARTKLKIMKSGRVESSLNEFISFKYIDELQNKLPVIMQNSLKCTDAIIQKMYNYNLKDTLQNLLYYNITVSNMYQKLFEFCLFLSKEKYEDSVKQIEKEGFIK